MREIDIAIIGGGPGGSATCFGLQSVLGDSAKVEIFERASQFKPVGGIISLFSKNLETAYNALQEGLYDELREVSFIRRSLKRFDHLGNFEKDMYAGGVTSYVVPWYRIQQLFQKKLKKDSVNFNHEICGLEEVEDGVILSFESHEKVKAKLVVGSDGNYSKTRMLLFNEQAPDYSGTCVWRLQCEGYYKELPPDTCHVYIGNSKLWACQCTPDHLEDQKDKFRTFISGIAGWPKERLAELQHVRYQGPQRKLDDPTIVLNRFEENFQDFPQEFVKWIKTHVQHEMSLEHAIYARDPYAPWGKGRVSLVGDAAHVMPPNGSQGLPMAAEDAVEISHAVSEFGITQAALREYENRRIARVLPIQELVLKGSESFYIKGNKSSDPFKSSDDERKAYQKINNYNPKPIKRCSQSVAASMKRIDFRRNLSFKYI